MKNNENPTSGFGEDEERAEDDVRMTVSRLMMLRIEASSENASPYIHRDFTCPSWSICTLFLTYLSSPK